MRRPISRIANVIFDAIVLRALLVSALMRLMGRVNWRMPMWTRKALFIRGHEQTKPVIEAS